MSKHLSNQPQPRISRPTLIRERVSLAAIAIADQLIHHALHAIDNYLSGCTLQGLSLITGKQAANPEINAIFLQQMVDKYLNISHLIVDAVYDHEVEFEFVLNLILDGLELQRTAI